MSKLDDILSQAFTDGASDTMWQDDRHIEIFATAKQEMKDLILELIGEPDMDKLNYDNYGYHEAQIDLQVELRKKVEEL